MIARGALAVLLASLPAAAAAAAGTDDPAGVLSVQEAAALESPPGPDSRWPQLLGAQYTFIEQWQSARHITLCGPAQPAPRGRPAANAHARRYSGWAPLTWAQLYFDVDKFMGAGVSGAMELGGPTKGDVIRAAYLNTARLGDYQQALAIAATTGTVPDIAANAENGRHKVGFGINLEQPLADDDNSGVFMRLGWNDGHTESFVFTEVDRLVSIGGQLSGVHWRRTEDYLGMGLVAEGLSSPHRDYLAAGARDFSSAMDVSITRTSKYSRPTTVRGGRGR
jgi:hypothetical protein